MATNIDLSSSHHTAPEGLSRGETSDSLRMRPGSDVGCGQGLSLFIIHLAWQVLGVLGTPDLPSGLPPAPPGLPALPEVITVLLVALVRPKAAQPVARLWCLLGAVVANPQPLL